MREGLLERVWCGNQSYPWFMEFNAQPPVFELTARDTNIDSLNLGLVYGSTTPASVNCDPQGENGSGYFEWTPGQDIVNQRTEDEGQKTDQAYTFTFSANDGQTTTLRTVQVRVFDVNRVPQLQVSNHAVVEGQTLSLPVHLPNLPPLQGEVNQTITLPTSPLKGDGQSFLPLQGEGWDGGGFGGGGVILATDADGATQTAALTITNTREPSRSLISAPSSLNKASMSDQRTLPETGREKISFNVVWCLHFMVKTILNCSINCKCSQSLRLATRGAVLRAIPGGDPVAGID